MTKEVAHRTIGNSIWRMGTHSGSMGATTLDDPNIYTAFGYYANTDFPIDPSLSPAMIRKPGDTVTAETYHRPPIEERGRVMTYKAQNANVNIFETPNFFLAPAIWASNTRHIQWKHLFGSSGQRTVTIQLPGQTEEKLSMAFTVLPDLSFVGTPSVTQHVWYLNSFTKLPYGKDLAQRILQIDEDLKEDQEEPIALAEGSMRALIEFLEANPTVARPQLAASLSGYLIARWIAPERRKMTIHFYADGRAEYYQFAPNPRHPDKQDMDTSLTTADALGAKLATIGAISWMKDGR
jgi:hypothetical protein